MKINVTGAPVAEKSFFTASLLRVLAILLILVLSIFSSCNNVPENTAKSTAQTTPQTTDFAYQYNEPEVVDDALADIPRFATTPAGSMFTDAVMPQEFVVKNKRDTTIEGKKGIKVLIPKNCFDLPNPNAEVKVELKEYTNTCDFVFANLTTGSNGKMLESGGTIYINATSEGKNVSLKKGQKLSLAFPTGKAKPKPGMQTFYGEKAEDGSINWKPTIYKAQTVKNNFKDRWKILKWNKKETTRLTYGQKVSLLTNWKYQLQAYGSNNHCTRFTDSTDYRNVLEYFQDNFTISPEDCKLLKGSYFIFSYKCDYNGDMYEPTLVLEHHAKKFFNKLKQKAALNRVKSSVFAGFKNMPKGEATAFKGREVSRLYINDFSQYKDTGSALVINDNKRKKYVTDITWEPADSVSYEKYQLWLDSLSKVAAIRHDSLMKTDADYYMMNTGKLGWINCDRFYNVGRPTQVVVDAGMGEGLSVKIIFKNINSVMSASRMQMSREFLLGGLPDNTDVKVMVVDKRPEGVFYAMKDYTTGSGVVKGFDFKPMTVEAIKKELAAL